MPEPIATSQSSNKNEAVLSRGLGVWPVSVGGVIGVARESWRILTQHWVLVYPLLLFALMQDLMSPAILSGFVSGDVRLLLLLAVLGLVWVVFYTGLLGMMMTAIDTEKQLLVKAQKATVFSSDSPTAALPAPVSVLTLWGGFLDAIGRHMITMVLGWLIVLLGIGLIALGTHWVILQDGGYPSVVYQAWQYVKTMPIQPDFLETIQDDFYSHLQALPPQTMQALDRLTWQWLGGMAAVGIWLLMTLFWAPAVVRANVGLGHAMIFTLKQFGIGLFVWVLLVLLAYAVLMCVQFVGLLHPVLMLLHWIVLMVLQAWLLLTVCVVVDRASHRSAKPQSPRVDVSA